MTDQEGKREYGVPHDCLTREHDPDEWCPDCFPIKDEGGGREHGGRRPLAEPSAGPGRSEPHDPSDAAAKPADLHMCEYLENALRDGFLERDPLGSGEIILPRRKLTDVAPNAVTGNVLTGETYDPSTFAIALALSFCPFCGEALTVDALYKSEEDGLDA